MWYFGICTALLSSILGGLGDNLIRLSFTLEEELDSKDRRPVVMRPIWLLGIFFSCILNAILIIISLNFASAMIVTPFSGLHIFWSIIFSKYILNEEIRSRHYKGTGLVISGLLFIIMFGIKDVPVYSVGELSVLYTRPRFVLYCMVNVSFILVCMYVAFFGLDDAHYKGELDLSSVAICEESVHDDKRMGTETGMDVGARDQGRVTGKDIIIPNKNTLHFKISILRDYMSKQKYVKYRSSDQEFGGSLEGIYSCHTTSQDSIMGGEALKTTRGDEDTAADEVFVNDSSDISYGFGKGERSTCEHGRQGFGARMRSYLSAVEGRFQVASSVFFELTKGFPRVRVATPIKRFSICSVSGLSGGYTNVLVQNLIQIVLADGAYVLLRRLTYQLLFTIFVTGSVQWAFWNAALSKYQAIFVVPIVNSVLIASSGFCNLMLYYDKKYASSSVSGTFYQLNFLIGQFLIVFGIYLISRARRNLTKESDGLNKTNESATSVGCCDQDAFEQGNVSSSPAPESTGSKLLFYLKSRASRFLSAKKEKISSSLESLLGFSKSLNFSSSHASSSIPKSKYLRNINQTHIGDTIILPQEEYDDDQFYHNNNLGNHVENSRAVNPNAGIEETCQEEKTNNVESNYTLFKKNNNNNNIVLGQKIEETETISQQIEVPLSPAFSPQGILNPYENDVMEGGGGFHLQEHHRKFGIELESYVLDEYDIDDLETPFPGQHSNYIREEGHSFSQYDDYYINDYQMDNDGSSRHSMLGFGDDILEESATRDYYQDIAPALASNKEPVEYPRDFNKDVLNSDFATGRQDDLSIAAHDHNHDLSLKNANYNPSFSTCSTNSSMLNSAAS